MYKNIKLIGYFRSFFAVVCLYLFVNNPILVSTNGVGAIKLLYPIAILYLLFNRKCINSFLNLFKKEVFLFVLLLLFIIFRSALGGDELYIRAMITAVFENIVVSAFLVLFLSKSKVDNSLNSIFVVGIVGAIISTVCLFDPSFNIYIKELQVLGEFSSEASFRSFGLADGLTFSYGISQGIILSILVLNSRNNIKYLLFAPLFIISSLFNARTGILIVGIILIYEIIVHRRFKLLFVISTILLILSAFADLLIFSIGNEDATKWVSGFFLEVGDLFMGTNNADFDTAEVLFEEMIVLPDSTLEWLVGSGQSSYGLLSASTDIGFLLQLKYGGLIFITILYSIVYLCIYRTFKILKFRWFSILFLVSFIVANFKGDFIPYTGSFRLLFLVYCYLVYINDKQIRKNIKFLK